MGWEKLNANHSDVKECSDLFLDTSPNNPGQVYLEKNLRIRLTDNVLNNATKPSIYSGSTFELYLFKDRANADTPEIALAFNLSLKRKNNGSGIELISFYHWHIHVGLLAGSNFARNRVFDEVKEGCKTFLSHLRSKTGNHQLFVVGLKLPPQPALDRVDQLAEDFRNANQPVIHKGPEKIISTFDYPSFNKQPHLHMCEILDIS